MNNYEIGICPLSDSKCITLHNGNNVVCPLYDLDDNKCVFHYMKNIGKSTSNSTNTIEIPQPLNVNVHRERRQRATKADKMTTIIKD